jgi:hypothetical protein
MCEPDARGGFESWRNSRTRVLMVKPANRKFNVSCSRGSAWLFVFALGLNASAMPNLEPGQDHLRHGGRSSGSPQLEMGACKPSSIQRNRPLIEAA